MGNICRRNTIIYNKDNNSTEDDIVAVANYLYDYDSAASEFKYADKYRIKYYSICVKKGDIDAMIKLGNIYYKKENYDLMRKYYLMAAEKGSTDALISMATYYRKIEKNYNLMEKYFSIAIEKNDTIAMILLADYYNYRVKNKYNLMIKYYLMAVKNGSEEALLYKILSSCGQKNEYYFLGKKYYLIFYKYNKDTHDTKHYRRIFNFHYQKNNYNLL